jgi:CRP/FNR family cyclic AMP-dependent transcriptional regulator
MDGKTSAAFNATHYLRSDGEGRKIVNLKAKQIFFSQGGAADAVFYLQSGRAKLTVVSKKGKEATVTLLAAGTLWAKSPSRQRERSEWPQPRPWWLASRSRSTGSKCSRVLHDEHAFAALFLNFMLLRGMRTQADLIDQLFNSSERRLARILLLMADFGKPGEPEETQIPHVTQETLAEMIGS